MKKYEHKDCRYCFRSYFTEHDQCHVPCKGVEESIRGYKMDNNPTNRFLQYLVKINTIKDWKNATEEQRGRFYHLCKTSKDKDKVYLHGINIPEYRHCRFQLTYPKW